MSQKKTFLMLLLIVLSWNALLIEPTQAEVFPSVSYTVNDSQFGYKLESSLTAFTQEPNGGTSQKIIDCKTWDDVQCASATQLLADLIEPPCIKLSDRGCIEKIEIAPANGPRETLTLVGEETRTSIPGKVFTKNSDSIGSLNIPRGGGISLWQSNQLDEDGQKKLYMSHLLARYSYYCGDLKNVPNLTPIKSKSGTCAVGTFDFRGSVLPIKINTRNGSCEFFTFQNSCVHAQNYSGFERVSITLRQDKQLTGWLFGRMKNADFSVIPIDDQFNQIRIEGQPTYVPALVGKTPKNNLDRYPKLESYLRRVFNGSDKYNGLPNYNFKNSDGKWLTYEEFLKQQETVMLSQIYNRWDLFNAFEEILASSPQVAKNNGVYSAPSTNSIMWNFSSAVYESADSNPCSADKSILHGLVVTNAPVYETGPPKFQDGTLNYRVAGIHYQSDGSEFKGEYTFVVRSTTARCYYGFSSAPIEAKVSVVSATGTEQIATTVVSERDNFLKLQANGFTFSSPTIKIKLIQSNPIKKVETKTILCSKGKLTKKISGANPKCPSGFKIKR